MIRTIQNFELFYKKLFQLLNILTYRKRHFERGFCKWNNFMMLKYLIQTSIFRYSKNYGSLTHETRIKDAVNMGDLICLLATVRTLKIIKGKYLLTEYVVNTSFYCIILRLSFANSISNVLSNRTTLMVQPHLGVLYPKFVYCLVLPLFFLLSLLTITRGTLMVWLATTWHFSALRCIVIRTFVKQKL